MSRPGAQADFDEAAWTERLGAALEQVAAEARPRYSPLPPLRLGIRPAGEELEVLRRGYHDLAVRAKHDPSALRQFNESSLWIEADPIEVKAILREHPLMEPGLEGSGTNEGLSVRLLNMQTLLSLTGLVSSLAKLSVKEGGEEASRRLHAYLTAGANATMPAHEITVIHGLVVKTPVNLQAGAYLAPYEDARAEFDLPDEPEPFPTTTFPDAAVLVRSLEYGPGVAAPDDGVALPRVQVSYGFPADYTVDLESWFDDGKFLVDLLATAIGALLLSRTCYVRLARWLAEIHRNLALGTQTSGGFTSDAWPQGHELSTDDVDAFLDLVRGWHKYPDRPDAMRLAVRRLAGSFSRPGGRFGQEDRVLDVAIALEVLYGG